VTILGVLLGLPAAALNLTGHYYWAIAVFHLFFLLDGADGTLARGTRATSAVGAYLDDLSHYVFHGLFFISFGLGLALEGRGVGGVLALAAGLSNTLNRAHLDLIGDGSHPGSDRAADASNVSLAGRVRSWILGTFDFPNILIFLTITAWHANLLNGYLAYCAAANLLYLAYCGVRRASKLAQLRSSLMDNSRAVTK
jgi:hypothetical protein